LGRPGDDESGRIPIWDVAKGLSEFVNRRRQTTQWPKEKGQRDKQRSTKGAFAPLFTIINVSYTNVP
jgi:hypothetical protein